MLKKMIIDSIILSLVWALVAYWMEQPDKTPLQQDAAQKPGLPTQELVIENANQQKIRITAEIVSANDQQNPAVLCNGFAVGHGMLFIWPGIAVDAWMKNCSAPIDVLFIGPEYKIVALGTDNPQGPSLSSNGESTAAILELKAGAAAALAVKVGDVVKY